MINEEIRGRLVERADNVAEQEEIDHFLQIIEEKLEDVPNFCGFSEILQDFSEFRKNHYVLKKMT